MKTTLEAISSDGVTTYSVDFIINDTGKLAVFCSCPAGEWGKFCKHKWQLLHGDESMLADLSQLDELKTIASIAKEHHVDDLFDDINKLEKDKKTLTKALKLEKESLDRRLSSKQILDFQSFSSVYSTALIIEHKLSYNTYLISKNRQIIEDKLKKGF